jgi:hypothetical protein
MLQPTLDFLEHSYDVHVLTYGVSSCNNKEVVLALEQMGQAGAQVTTKCSRLPVARCVLYARPIISIGDIKGECRLVDASSLNFKAFAIVTKAEKETTMWTLQTFLPIRHAVL